MAENSMKVLCIQGSPRKNGNTVKVLGWVEEELRFRGHYVEHIDIRDHKLEGCCGCYFCQINPDELECSRKDNGVRIFTKMKEADAVVYATPLYCWDFSSQMKPFIDRHVCLCTGAGDPEKYKSHVGNKPVALLVTAMGPDSEGNSDLIKEIFRRLSDYVSTNPVAELVVPNCTEPKDLGEEQRKMAVSFAQKIAS